MFDKHAPKKSYIYHLTISPSLIMKFLRQSLRSMLRNWLLQNRSEEKRKLFCKQRNNYVLLLRKSKKDYYATLNERNITDNKHFWKNIKPLL